MVEKKKQKKRQRNDGLRKLCGCKRRDWPTCGCAWHFNYKPTRGPHAGTSFRFSLDRELRRHIIDKRDALIEANRIRTAIDAGTFRADVVAAAKAAGTLEQLGRLYFKRPSPKTGELLGPNEQYRWDLMMRTEIRRASGTTIRVGRLDIRAVTSYDLEALFETLRQPRTETFISTKKRKHEQRRGGRVSSNRCHSRLRTFYNWAIEKGHADATPFKRGTVTIVRQTPEAKRERRLQPAHGEQSSEQERLFAAANPHLQALIIAALETACRKGELLSLQWHQVRWDLDQIHLPAKKTKARRRRELPMSQALRALLEMRRTDPNGVDYPPDAYVFGDVTGARVLDVKTAWTNAVLKSHGMQPVRTKNGCLTKECQQQLEAIDLNFHDLRREAGSRFLEYGMAPHYVQAFLDHANLSTTSRYLNITAVGMQAALKDVDSRRLEGKIGSVANSVANAPIDGSASVSDESRKLLQ